MAAEQMVIDHAHGLHEGVNDRWADKFESARGEFFGQFDRQFRLGRDLLHVLQTIDFRPAIDEIPQELGKSGPVLHDF
jgi:hypothetical protein